MKKFTLAVLSMFVIACNAPKQFQSLDQGSQQKAGDETCQSNPLQVNIPNQVNTGIPFQLSVNHPQAHWRITYKGVGTAYDGQVITLNLSDAGSYSGLVIGVDECGVSDTVEFSFRVNAGVQSAMIQINNGDPYTNNQAVSLTLSAQNADQMFITNDSSCNSGGSWESYATAKQWNLALKNQSNTVYAKFKNATSVSSCVQAQIVHDNIAPKLSWIKTPTALTSDTTAHFEWSATEQGSGIKTQVCQVDNQTGNNCADKIDFNNLALGNHNFYIVAMDSAGNVSKLSYQWLIGSVVGTSSIVINNGALYTKQIPVQLTLSSVNALEMYVTNVADCSSGGVWETYSTQKSWNVPNSNLLNTVYAKFRNAVSSSACVSAQITHDNTAPVITFTQKPIDPSNDINPQFIWTMTDAGSGIKNQLCSIDNKAFTKCYFSSSYISLAVGSHTFTVVGFDFAGNQSQAKYDWTIAPVVGSATILINGGAAYTKNVQVNLTLSAVNADQMLITNNSDCTTDGVWETYSTSKAWTLAGDNQQNTVYAKFKNSVSTTACVSAQIIHDNVAPVLAFTQKPANPSNGINAKFAWTITDNVSGLKAQMCSLDGQAYVSCNLSELFTNLSYGAHSFTVAGYDNAGNQSQINHKWTIYPTVNTPSLVINGGATYTTDLKVSLTLSAINAAEMLITNSSDCSTGGIWESFTTSKNWKLSSANQINSLYAKFRNVVSETVCIRAEITHDNLAPVITFTAKPPTSTMDTDANFAWTVFDNLSGIASEKCQIDSSVPVDCKNALYYSKLAVGVHTFAVTSSDNAGNASRASHTWTITAPPPPVLSEGTCKGGESLTSCLKCEVPQPPVIPPWTPRTKAEKLAEIQRLSCEISNKSDYMYNNYDASRPPTREQIFSKIQACTAELYPDSPLSGANLDTINALLNAKDDSMRKKIYGGLWYKPPFTDYFELYFGISSLEARQVFCYGQDALGTLQGNLVTSEYAEACYESEYKCDAWKNDKQAQARWKEVQRYRKQLRDCIGKSIQLPPIEPPKPWVQPVCTYKQFDGYFEVGGQAYLDALLANGYKVSVETNNACVVLTSSKTYAGLVHIGGYKCQ